MPLISTLGAMSSRGFGEFAQQTAANYIEDVFSTYLYTGNSSTQTITNGIDLSGKGGLVWAKLRNSVNGHALIDTARSIDRVLDTSSTAAAAFNPSALTSFNSNGFTLGATNSTNGSGYTYAAWTFRKQPKFFDVVTYTGDGAASQTINHNLSSVPGMVIIKRTDSTSDWVVWHRSFTLANNAQGMLLNGTAAFGNQTGNSVWGSTSPMTATTFSVGASGPGTWNTNLSGGTYVAYLFAHNAGGFGADGSQNVISCGSYTTDSSAKGSATLGFEPQFIIAKAANAASDWLIQDVMRGESQTQNQMLLANSSGAEYAQGASGLIPNATGFTDTGNLVANGTVIYMAIRRGPMRTPTDATKVYTPINNPTFGVYDNAGFPVDLFLSAFKSGGAGNETLVFDRLRGSGTALFTQLTSSEVAGYDSTMFASNTGIKPPFGSNEIVWHFRRAPGFFDVVCYTGTGSSLNVTHNLGVVPELVIVKRRNTSNNWVVQSSYLPDGYDNPLGHALTLNSTAASSQQGYIINVSASSFSPSGSVVNASGGTYVAYLFATCPGVSKVGSYTGTGATQTISCGFTGGARYVLIKRTDSTGSWWVWDTARGMVAGTDPRLAYNSTAAETNANWVYTTTGGFQIVTSDATVNASGGSYIFLAIA